MAKLSKRCLARVVRTVKMVVAHRDNRQKDRRLQFTTEALAARRHERERRDSSVDTRESAIRHTHFLHSRNIKFDRARAPHTRE